MSLDKDLLRELKEKHKENIISYLSTYNLKDTEMFRIILDNVQIVNEAEKLRNILCKYELI